MSSGFHVVAHGGATPNMLPPTAPNMARLVLFWPYVADLSNTNGGKEAATQKRSKPAKKKSVFFHNFHMQDARPQH